MAAAPWAREFGRKALVVGNTLHLGARLRPDHFPNCSSWAWKSLAVKRFLEQEPNACARCGPDPRCDLRAQLQMW